MVCSIRVRLTIWNGVVTALIVFGLCIVIYFAFADALMQRVDANLTFEYTETVERLEKLGPNEDLGGVPEAFLQEFRLRITDDAGTIRMQSPSLTDVELNFPAETGTIEPTFQTTTISGHGIQRMMCVRMDGIYAGWTVLLAASLEDYERELARLRRILLGMTVPGGIVVLVAGYLLAGRSLDPVKRMADAAQRISASNLHERITPQRWDDELGQLASTINAMIQRLADSLESTRQFTADASHELMTPLTLMRAEAEIALQRERSGSEYRRVLQGLIDDVDRLTRLASQLLTLAREDSGQQTVPSEVIEPSLLVRAAVEKIRNLAAEADVILSTDELCPVVVAGSSEDLRQAVDNLLHNAVRYNRPGGSVRVSVQAQGREAIIAVADTGIGIPTDFLTRIFERFCRVDPSRSRQHGGAGLGLSIARSLVERMGGRIEVESTPDVGSTFRIRLPLCTAADS